ncbi:MAG: hypothetical protein HYW69_02420, partial [Candidatus Nealsonbacteria bacterium]|nr:hypothetical protein [Candidatus Nealsonbacteria bacterium]
MPPEGFEGQEFERQYQEQYQQQYQQQMEQQIQQQIQQQIEELSSQEEIGVSKQFCLENPTDPLCVGYEQAQISSEYCATNPTDPLCGGQQLPFLEQVKNFLAGLIPAI